MRNQEKDIVKKLISESDLMTKYPEFAPGVELVNDIFNKHITTPGGIIRATSQDVDAQMIVDDYKKFCAEMTSLIKTARTIGNRLLYISRATTLSKQFNTNMVSVSYIDEDEGHIHVINVQLDSGILDARTVVHADCYNREVKDIMAMCTTPEFYSSIMKSVNDTRKFLMSKLELIDAENFELEEVSTSMNNDIITNITGVINLVMECLTLDSLIKRVTKRYLLNNRPDELGFILNVFVPRVSVFGDNLVSTSVCLECMYDIDVNIIDEFDANVDQIVELMHNIIKYTTPSGYFTNLKNKHLLDTKPEIRDRMTLSNNVILCKLEWS